MSILDFNEGEKHSSTRRVKALVGSSLLIATLIIGSTLAANININSGPVEFGQGVAQTTACDDAITITPVSDFINGASPSPSPSPSASASLGHFLLSRIDVSEIDSSIGRCQGKYLTIKAYDNSSSTPLEFFAGTSSLVVYDNGSSFTGAQAGIQITSQANTEFSLQISASTLNANLVYKITIESSDTSSVIVDSDCSSIPDGAPSYYPCGPQLDVPISTLTDAGWTLCFEDNYSNKSRPVSDALNACDQPYLAVLGRAIDTPTALLVAFGPTSEIFRPSDANAPHIAHGTYWYYTPFAQQWSYDPLGTDENIRAQSFGFSPDPIIQQDTCDYNQEPGDPTAPYRLCWHIYNSELLNDNMPTFNDGHRIGIEDDDNTQYDVYDGNYLRVIYEHS
jgi:hypothetical protein